MYMPQAKYQVQTRPCVCTQGKRPGDDWKCAPAGGYGGSLSGATVWRKGYEAGEFYGDYLS